MCYNFEYFTIKYKWELRGSRKSESQDELSIPALPTHNDGPGSHTDDLINTNVRQYIMFVQCNILHKSGFYVCHVTLVGMYVRWVVGKIVRVVFVDICLNGNQNR